MTSGMRQQREVWLRGNLRPVVGLAGAALTAGAAAVIAAAAAGAPAWLVGLLVGGTGSVLAGLAVIGRAAARPRLARQGDTLEIRLTPATVERVPLDVVECVFRGSEPIADQPGGEARFRVGTLVIRFAERASEWRTRATFGPWGSWSDGHAIIDGRWCEPLSRPVVERIAAALLDAKRPPSARAGA